MADDGGNQEKETEKKIIHVYPLVKVKHDKATQIFEIKSYHLLSSPPSQHSDMNEEMRTEAIELSITACEKYSSNYEVNFFNCQIEIS